MNKYIYILLLIIFAFQAHSHNEHLKCVKKIGVEILRNGEVIGYSNYFFDHGNDKMTVKNYTKFKVELFGVSVFSVSSETIEGYENNELIYFKSNTFQNDKEKYGLGAQIRQCFPFYVGPQPRATTNVVVLAAGPRARPVQT